MSAAGKQRILVVDDDDSIIDAVTTALGSTYEVTTAHDGREALEMLERGPTLPAVLVLDLMMPRMGGEELIHELAARHICVPVVISSANHDLFATCRRLGDLPCVQKPYTLKQLRDALDGALSAPRIG